MTINQQYLAKRGAGRVQQVAQLGVVGIIEPIQPIFGIFYRYLALHYCTTLGHHSWYYTQA
jgi:hypothetical protein